MVLFSDYQKGTLKQIDKLIALAKEKDKIIIILAWRYSDIIIANNNYFLQQGGKFIIPLPAFKLVEI